VKWIVLACLLATTGTWCALRSPPANAPQDCAGDCGELVRFLPSIGPGYFDDAVPEEQGSLSSTSYVRRDLMMLVKRAAARVGTDHPIGLGDGSERDGRTPGSRYGRPRHPRHTHRDGRDMDIAYYQRGTDDNRLRAVCPVGTGIDAFHCIGPPDHLDVRRTALFIATLYESDRVRIVGVDGMVAPLLSHELERICKRGIVSKEACGRMRLGYETEPSGRGWYYGHHNHMHVSLKP
jgi:hypothetical protein